MTGIKDYFMGPVCRVLLAQPPKSIDRKPSNRGDDVCTCKKFKMRGIVCEPHKCPLPVGGGRHQKARAHTRTHGTLP